MWSFTDLDFFQDPIFDSIIARLKDPVSKDAFLDVACGLGQVLRKLTADGINPSKLYGTDILGKYLDLGFELFRDRDRFPSGHFTPADLLQSGGDDGLGALEGKMTLIHASNFFHLFDWDEQVRIGRNLVRLMQPGASDRVIFGRHIGRRHAGTMVSARSGGTRYLHDLGSFQKLWDEIGLATGTSWIADAQWVGDLPFQIPGFPEDTLYMKFVIRQQ